MSESGYIRYRCPDCGRVNRLLVTFPAYNKPFNPTTDTCTCGAFLEITDPHKFNEDGTIIDKGDETNA